MKNWRQQLRAAWFTLTSGEAIQSYAVIGALCAIGYGLWLVHPSAAFIGIGSLVLLSVIMTRCVIGKKQETNDA